MKFICDRAALLEGLTATSGITPTRTTRPILQCVRLTADKESLTLTAYDQEVGLRYRVKQLEVSRPGEALVMGERLMSIVREVPDETLAVETEGDMLHVRGGNSHFQITGQAVRDFPPVPDMEGKPDFSASVGALREAITKTVFAAARENTRYAINGVLWQQQGRRLNLVATDGRRLALSAAPLSEAAVENAQAIVPSKPLLLLGRLHVNADEVVEVKVHPNQIIIRLQEVTISSVLVEGHFPKWEDVIPQDMDKEVTLSASEFMSAVRQASLLASVESKGIRIHLTDGKMVVSGHSAEQGEATINVKVDYKGADLQIGFNPEFLIDALKVCGDEAVLQLKEASRPGVITCGKNFKYVVMPVNLS